MNSQPLAIDLSLAKNLCAFHNLFASHLQPAAEDLRCNGPQRVDCGAMQEE